MTTLDRSSLDLAALEHEGFAWLVMEYRGRRVDGEFSQAISERFDHHYTMIGTALRRLGWTAHRAMKPPTPQQIAFALLLHYQDSAEPEYRKLGFAILELVFPEAP